MANPQLEVLLKLATEHLGSALQAHRCEYDELTVTIDAAMIVEACVKLRDTPGLKFEQLSDLSGVDYSTFGKADWVTQQASSSGFSRAVGTGQVKTEADATLGRFAVVYQLISVSLNQRLRVKAYLNDDPPRLPSVTEVWPVADWYEREAFDLFGILFEGHPDLRRILTDYGFIGHPFRKDFPISGNVEMRYDPDQRRVIYQPVTIDPREITPRIVREENYAGGAGFRKG